MTFRRFRVKEPPSFRNLYCQKKVHRHDSIVARVDVCQKQVHLHDSIEARVDVCQKEVHLHDSIEARVDVCQKEVHFHYSIKARVDVCQKEVHLHDSIEARVDVGQKEVHLHDSIIPRVDVSNLSTPSTKTQKLFLGGKESRAATRQAEENLKSIEQVHAKGNLTSMIIVNRSALRLPSDTPCGVSHSFDI